MYHLLGPHFPVFALTNWATLAGISFGKILKSFIMLAKNKLEECLEDLN